jgi:hypothetical protein
MRSGGGKELFAAQRRIALVGFPKLFISQHLFELHREVLLPLLPGSLRIADILWNARESLPLRPVLTFPRLRLRLFIKDGIIAHTGRAWLARGGSIGFHPGTGSVSGRIPVRGSRDGSTSHHRSSRKRRSDDDVRGKGGMMVLVQARRSIRDHSRNWLASSMFYVGPSRSLIRVSALDLIK